jgi:protease IV
LPAADHSAILTVMEDDIKPSETVPPPVPPTPGPAPQTPPVIAGRPPLPSSARKGRGWMITSIILFCLLGLSLMSHLTGLLSTFVPGAAALEQPAGPRLEEAVIESEHTRNKIAVITIGGIIMGESIDGSSYGLVDVIQAQLKRAAEDDQVKAVLLKVDSPGGEVLASDEIYRALLRFQKDTKKPVVTSMGTLAASGGYYVSAPSQWIVANELTITGSIGVIMSGLNYRGLMDKVGLKPEVFKSGKYKDMLRGSKEPNEITPEERKMIQDLIDETFQRFKAVVKEGRDFAAEKNRNLPDKGQALAPDWGDYADGRILSGKEARRLGLVDELGDLKTAVKRARKLAGIQEASLVEYRPVFDLSNLFRLFGKTDFKSVKVDLGLNLPKLKAGQPYFLSPLYLY